MDPGSRSDPGPGRPHRDVHVQQRPGPHRRGSDHALRVRHLRGGSGWAPEGHERELQQHCRVPEHGQGIDLDPVVRVPCAGEHRAEQRVPGSRGRPGEWKALRRMVRRSHRLVSGILGPRVKLESRRHGEHQSRDDRRLPMGRSVCRQGRCRVLRYYGDEQGRSHGGLEHVHGPDHRRRFALRPDGRVCARESRRGDLYVRHRLCPGHPQPARSVRGRDQSAERQGSDHLHG